MTAYIMALAAAMLYGAADFAGGLSTKRAGTTAVVVVSQASGFLLLALALPLFPAASPTRADLLWGVVAGFSGGIGVALLYRGLAIGTMAVVAPTTAVCAVAIPVMASIALGERPSPWVLNGIVLGIIAIVLVSRPAAKSDRGGAGAVVIATALGSGVAIGCFLLALARTRADAGMWPLLVARSVSVSSFTAVAIVTRQTLRMPAPVLALTLAAGVGDILANALYMVAARIGPVSGVVTLSSLYPASTVILAWLVLGERLAPWQRVGVAFALIAIALIVGRGPA
ncbi:MAG: EamA family transporter [Gemmatimonadota bacterium]